MELEKQVQQHEDKLKQHDKELSRLNDFTVEMQKSMNEGLTRVDESNRFLREQNTRQSEQNAEILQAVIKRNEHSEERQNRLDELETKQNVGQDKFLESCFWCRRGSWSCLCDYYGTYQIFWRKIK